jgi:tRNA-dihydrouridine synthase
MIGRAALGRPWLFRQIEAALAGRPIPAEPNSAEKRQLLLEHLRLHVDRHGPKLGTVMMRPAAVRYAQGLPGARTFRAQVSRASNPEQFVELVSRFFPGQDGLRHDGAQQ